MFKQLLDSAALKLEKAGIGQWEIALLHRFNLSLGIKENNLDKLQESEDLGLSLRIVHDNRLGFSFLMGSDLSRLDAAIELALAGARVSDPAEGFGFAGIDDLRGNQTLSMFQLNSEADLEPIGDKLERNRLMAQSALAASPLVSHVYPAETSQSLGRFYLRTSAGFDGCHNFSLVWAGCAAVAEKDGQQEEAWEGETACAWSDIDLAGVGRRAGLKAAASLGAQAAPSGRYPVLLSNEVAAYFVGLMASSLKADNIGKGRSLLAGRQGQQVIAPMLTLFDDPLKGNAPYSRPFDDEGTASRRMVLIENGLMRDFIRDRFWGARLGLPSTGNSQRSGSKSPPEVGFSNLLLAAGDSDVHSIIKNMKQGIIVEQVLGGHTADPISGQFSLGLAGKLVQDGQIAAPIRGNALAGQVLELFASVNQVGSDLKCFGQIWAPSLLIEELAVSGPTG